MMKQIGNLLALSALLCLDYSVAFSVAPARGLPSTASTVGVSRPSTCLFLSDEQEQSAGESAQEQNSNNNAPDDILNSPAFLKRKIDVLKSDIAKTEEGIAAAKQRLEEGKAEWGGQLEELQKEVSVLWKYRFAMALSFTWHRRLTVTILFCLSMRVSTKHQNYLVRQHSSTLEWAKQKRRQYGYRTSSSRGVESLG